jgi:transposase
MSADIVAAPKSNDPAEVRRQRGLAIAAVTRITQKYGQWIVPSQTVSRSYQVNLDPPPFVPKCTCKDYAKREQDCKHVYAVREFIAQSKGQASVQEPSPDPLEVIQKTTAPRPTYKQNWPAYDKAQIMEKAGFQELLAELCRDVQEPARPHGGAKGGRLPIPMSDRVFAMALKVYTTMSGRRASTDLREAHDKGYLSQVPHYSKIARFLEDPSLTRVLMSLIGESAKPLRSVESDFIVDSSGFTSSRFTRWFDHKYGVVKTKYDWMKVSVMTGRSTHVVTAVEIDEKYSADCPKFAPLLNATVANGFRLREVSADSAYLSYENIELVDSSGGTPYIAFKSDTKAEQGGIFTRMFHLYNLNRDDYINHYHKRSNVESTFSMIKAKFGDSLRSKTDTAMANEALCKVLCHNVVVLIQSACELGIEAKFWEQEEPGPVIKDRPVNDWIEAMAWA